MPGLLTVHDDERFCARLVVRLTRAPPWTADPNFLLEMGDSSPVYLAW
jgi:hypothetical protein